MKNVSKKIMLIISFLMLTVPFLFSQTTLQPGVTKTLEAEDGAYSDAELETVHAGFTGSAYLNFVNEVGGYVEWTVDVPSSGEGDCVFTFANGSTASRGMEIRVNGNVSLAEYAFPSTSLWTNWTSVSITIGLQEGLNKIRLTSTGSEGGPNLDRMEITLAGALLKAGDVNGDGRTDIVDALMTAQFYVGLNPAGFMEAYGDLDNNGTINIVDALIIAQIYVGLIDPPATPTPTIKPVTPTPTIKPVTPTPPPTTPPTGDTVYAAPSGKSSNGGTSFSDALDLKTALSRASAGKTILLQAGTYKIPYNSGTKSTFYLSKSGTSSNPIRIEGYNGQAKLDFQCPDGDWVQDSWGFELSGDYYHLKNIDFTRSPYHGMYVMGEHNTIENCNFYDNRTTGLELNKGGAYTTVIDCDSYDNYDPKRNGGMADGFASKQTQGKGNKFIRCNAWGNSDDGYDTYESDYTVTFEDCTANSNGTHDGNGNGFKLGGGGAVATQYLTNCIANNNRQHGFHANGNPGPIYLTNCSASGNGGDDYHGDFVKK